MKAIFEKFYKSKLAIAVGGVLLFSCGVALAMGISGGDSDGDGVEDSIDICAGTNVDQPSEDWGVNRYLWIGDKYFTVLTPEKGDKNKIASEFSMDQTKGCSCIDIVKASTDKESILKNSNYKLGCTRGVIHGWITEVNR